MTVLPTQANPTEQMRRIHKARMNVILGSPFFGTLLMRMPMIEDNTQPTFCTNGQVIKFNEKFCASLDDVKLRGVLVHEVCHVAQGHLWRIGGRNMEKWNQACVTGDSMVLMADGSEKRMDQIRKGDKIAGEENGVLKESIVLETLSKIDTLMEVRLHNGYQLTCTPTHRILTNSGYLETAACRTEATHSAFVVPRGLDLRAGQSRIHDHRGHGGSFRVELPSGGQLPSTERAVFAAEDREAVEPQGAGGFAARGLGVHGGNLRRGGHDQHSSNEGHVLPSGSGGDEHGGHVGGMVREVRVLQRVLNEQRGEQVLEDHGERVSNLGASGRDAAIPHHQETSSGIGASIHHGEAIDAASLGSDTDHAEYLPTDLRIKSARFKTVAALEGQHRVFDLTTTTHSYIVNGVITHNCDYAINNYMVQYAEECAALGLPVPWELPEGCNIDARFNDMSSEQIYAKLPDPPPGGGGGSGRGNPSPGAFEAPPKEPGEGEGEGQGEGQGEGNSEGSGGGESQVKGSQPSLEDEWKVAVTQAATVAKMRGTCPASIKKLVDELITPKVPWEEQLREFVSRSAKDDYTFARPARRYLGQGVILPGLHNERVGEIVVGVDTSGSIFCDPPLLKKFFGELQGILDTAKPSKMTVIYCDAAIHSVSEYEPSDTVNIGEAEGGGGTSFIPVFDYVDKKLEEPPVCLIYLTDTYGSFPRKEPGYPVMWACYGGDQVPWGEVIKVE